MIPQPATPPTAVFLSYAREDSETARRLADALREAGIEVWFDQEELRGGEAWDAKIRTQLARCTLFVPIISAQSNARLEGYFRIEWKLAAHRTHAMAEQRVFLLPVVVDDIRENEAVVPPEFTKVQWTRVVEPATMDRFVARVQRLLASPDATIPRGLPRGPLPPPVSIPPFARRPLPPWAMVAGAGLVAALVVVAWRPWAAGDTRPPTKSPVAEGTAVSTPALDLSIAVLPFENLSPERENEFFADGVHDDVLTSLQNIRQLRVVSRTSVQPYRKTTKPVRQIAQELGVSHLLEGTVRRFGNRVKVSAKLVDARTESQLWALPPTDRDLSDIFAIQSAIATEIAGALNAVLSPQERQLLNSARTIDLTAAELYHRALDVVDRVGGNVDGFSQAEPLLQSAVQLDPKFAAAWGKLALFLLRHQDQRRDPTGERQVQAQRAIDMVEQLAPERPESLLDLAAYYSRKLDYPRSDGYLRRAAVALPSHGGVAQRMGDVEQRMGNFAVALAEYRRAYALDRQAPEIRHSLRNWLIRVRRYEEAATVERDDPRADGYYVARSAFLARGSTREMEAWLAANPNRDRQDALNWLWDSGAVVPFVARCDELRRTVKLASNDETKLAFALTVRGETQRAHAEAEKQVAIARSGGPQGLISRIMAVNLALLGQREKALEALRGYLASAAEKGQNLDLTSVPTGKAVVLTWVGEHDQAIDELARLLRVPAGMNVHEMRCGIYWQPLRGHPRFEALLDDPKNNAPLL